MKQPFKAHPHRFALKRQRGMRSGRHNRPWVHLLKKEIQKSDSKKDQGGIEKEKYDLFSMFTVYLSWRADSFLKYETDMNPKCMN